MIILFAGYESDTLGEERDFAVGRRKGKMAALMNARKRMKAVVAVILIALAILLPEVVSAGWHLVHGRSIAFRAWKVAVPFEWYAIHHGEGMSVERMLRFSWNRNPVAVFLPVHFTKTFPFKYDTYGTEQELTLRARGYLLVGQKDVTIAKQGGRCWTFVAPARQTDVWIACIVPKDLTSIDYTGPRIYTNDFYSLLEKIQRSSSAN